MVVGFDLWNTLIKSNPLFAEAKKLLFEQYFPEYDPGDFIEAQKETKKDLDRLAEMTGYQSDLLMRQKMLMHYLSMDINNLDLKRSMYDFLNKYDDLFRLFPPIPYSNSTREWYEQIRDILPIDNKGSKVVIISNTMFQGHGTLKNCVNDLFYYDDFITSDVMGQSKPSKDIYPLKIDLFVGDNPITDGGYAKAVGAEFFQINTNNKTIKDVYEHIKSGAIR